MTKALLPETRDAVREVYQRRRQQFEAERDAHGRRSRLIATARLLTFAAAATGLVAGFWGLRVASPSAVALGVAASAVFIVLIFVHERVLRARDRAEALVDVNAESLLRMERRWSDLRKIPVTEESANHPVARDLDVLHSESGRASILQLLGTVNTPRGREVLIDWLLQGSEPEEILRRQQAVQELAGKLELRQELERRGRQRGDSPPDPEAFLSWAEGEPWLHKRPGLLWVSRLLGVTAVTFATLRILDIVPTGWVVVSLAVNLLLAFAHSRRILEAYETIAGRQGTVRHYARLFQLLDAQSFECDALREIEAELHPAGRSVSGHMRQLERLGGLADARFTPLFHIPLVALTLWDLHVIWGFERWQRSAGRTVRRWFRALGEIDALVALATLRHDHPNWTFPKVEGGGERRFRAKNLGHPLLPPSACVRNDIEIGPDGTFLLVTGSNMSGKSTLLRSIGTNAVLAQAGGPVCAEDLVMAQVALGTSFRVHDSLESGVSFFMAELERLAQIVSEARRRHDKDEPPLLYLLDEILQGTNVYERQIAVRRVILHLLRSRAIGAVSTHDLTLAEAADLSEAAFACHFTESYERDEQGPRMVFDYELRDGVASTRNALKLLEIVGLDEI